MKTFQVLPTDRRFLDLYEDQKLELFYGINHIPDESVLRNYVVKEEKRKEFAQKKASEFISQGLRNKMRETLKNQGMGEDQIEKALESYGMSLKQTKMQDLDEDYSKDRSDPSIAAAQARTQTTMQKVRENFAREREKGMRKK